MEIHDWFASYCHSYLFQPYETSWASWVCLINSGLCAKEMFWWRMAIVIVLKVKLNQYWNVFSHTQAKSVSNLQSEPLVVCNVSIAWPERWDQLELSPLPHPTPSSATMWPYVLTCPVVSFRFIVLHFLLLVSGLYSRKNILFISRFSGLC